MAAHALLGPSGASRWLACTPSARLETQFPDKNSTYAQEGSVAHNLGELKLQEYLKLVSKTAFNRDLKKIKASEYYNQAMNEYTDDYKVYCIEAFNDAQEKTKDAQIYLEVRLDLAKWIPGGFGTGDCVIIADGTLHVIDLKYGTGVPVSSENNKQMMLYGLAAYNQYEMLYDIDTIRMTIFQPRISNVSTWEISVADLLNWVDSELVPKAQMAWKGEGEYVAGSHCQFCRAKTICRAHTEMQMQLARHDFKAPPLLEPEEVAEILEKGSSFKSWVEEVSNYALEQAVNFQKEWPGFKLVSGRSVRVITDQDKAAEVLTKEGFKEDEIWKPKALQGITNLEKVIGKKTLPTLLGDLIEKPDGKPTLVPESDKRPALDSNAAAQKEFEGVVA